MIHILYGADDFSRRAALADLKRELGDSENLAHNTSWLEGARLDLNELRAAVESLPFFGDKRLVIVEGLLSRFDSARRGSKKPAASGTKAELSGEFADLINAMPGSTVLVLLDGELQVKEPAQNHPLLSRIPAAEIRHFPPLRSDRLEKWIVDRVKAGGADIAPGAVRLLAAGVGNDLWVMAGEIDKLAAFTAGGRIETGDVERVAVSSREAGIFDLVDNVMAGETARAQQLLHRLLMDGEAPVYILFMLTRQLRQMVRFKAMHQDGYDLDTIRTRLGLVDFILRKVSGQVSRYTMPQLKRFYGKLLETDIAIKSGQLDEDTALSLLVAETGSLAA